MPESRIQWLACAYAVALGYLLLAPEPLFFLGRTGAAIDATVSATVADWIEHGMAYAILAALFITAFGEARLTRPLAVALVHGISTETLQHWIPLREASWADGLANVSGIAMAAAVATVIRLSPFGQVDQVLSTDVSVRPVVCKSLGVVQNQPGE